MVSEGLLVFEGVLAYAASDDEEAQHFFGHTLGLPLMEPGEGVQLYALSDELAVAVDVGGESTGVPPYLLFSSPDIDAAREHFMRLGCEILDDQAPASGGAGFFARSEGGHIVCVVDQRSMNDAAAD